MAKVSGKGNRMSWAFLFILLALIGGVGSFLYLRSFTERDAETPAIVQLPPDESDISDNTESVIDLDRLENDPHTQQEADERKAALGLGSEVDIVASSDETIRIGDATIPMEEILSKIRLKRGDIVETDLPQTDLDGRKTSQADQQRIERQLRMVDQQITELMHHIDSTKQESDQAPLPPHELEAVIQKLRNYKAVLEALKNETNGGTEGILSPNQRHQMIALRRQLEGELGDYLPSEGDESLYGIYVVKPGDNIWNIHFRFLQAVFGRKGIVLSPVADEPDIDGFSSGVGKLLKFSENMVYIYNVRDRSLDANLDQIHPRSKIVVFNLKEVFSLLNQVDYGNIHHIQFDGETLWIPSIQ